MMPSNTDYLGSAPIANILQNPRLQDDKYGSESQKTVRIDLGKIYYDAGSALLKMLLERYGNIAFKEAIDKWENKK